MTTSTYCAYCTLRLFIDIKLKLDTTTTACLKIQEGDKNCIGHNVLTVSSFKSGDPRSILIFLISLILIGRDSFYACLFAGAAGLRPVYGSYVIHSRTIKRLNIIDFLDTRIWRDLSIKGIEYYLPFFIITRLLAEVLHFYYERNETLKYFVSL